MPSRNGKRPARKKVRPKTTAVVEVGALIAQPHGGALRNGGTNKGGTGPVPKEVRARARSAFYKRIPVLEKIADSTDATNGERIAAVDRLGKYGLSSDHELVVTTANARAFFDCANQAMRECVSEEMAERIIERTMDLFKGGKKV